MLVVDLIDLTQIALQTWISTELTRQSWLKAPETGIWEKPWTFTPFGRAYGDNENCLRSYKIHLPSYYHNIKFIKIVTFINVFRSFGGLNSWVLRERHGSASILTWQSCVNARFIDRAAQHGTDVGSSNRDPEITVVIVAEDSRNWWGKKILQY